MKTLTAVKHGQCITYCYFFQYGLYSAFMGSLVYVLFGTVKEVSIGPTSLMALLTFEYTQDLPIQFVTLLAFLSGCVELLMGFLNLGKTRRCANPDMKGIFLDFTSLHSYRNKSQSRRLSRCHEFAHIYPSISFKISRNLIDNTHCLYTSTSTSITEIVSVIKYYKLQFTVCVAL